MSPERDALVFKRLEDRTALRRIPVAQIPQFRAHGWTLLVSTTEFTLEDALETFAVEVTKPQSARRLADGD